MKRAHEKTVISSTSERWSSLTPVLVASTAKCLIDCAAITRRRSHGSGQVKYRITIRVEMIDAGEEGRGER